MKPEEDFRPGWIICSDCVNQARTDFYNRVKTGETIKNRKPKDIKKHVKVIPDHAAGAIHKRCPHCNTHVWVDQTDTETTCWKCQEKLKITKAIRNSTYHRGGLILSVIK